MKVVEVVSVRVKVRVVEGWTPESHPDVLLQFPP